MEPAPPLERRLLAHYESGDILARIDAGLAALGIDPACPDPAQLAPVDEFHVRGRAATAELIGRLGAGPGDRVLDIGSGLGGPARQLAAATGAMVTGIDLSPVYCEIATELTRRTGLAGQVDFRCQPVAALAETGPAFDAAWCIHVGMNVADKPAFHRDIARCLKPGGRFLAYDIVSTSGLAPDYPLPWASSAGESFLATEADMRTLLGEAGFIIDSMEDDSPAALAFLEAARTRLAGRTEPPPLALHLVLGPAFGEIIANLYRAFTDGRIGIRLFSAVRSG